MNLVVLQDSFPPYRTFIWQSLSKSFLSLQFIKISHYNIIRYRLTSFSQPRIFLVTGSPNNLFQILLLTVLFPFSSIVAFTQLSRKKNPYWIVFHVIYLNIFFNKVLFYYEHELVKAIKTSPLTLNKFSTFNNTVRDPTDLFVQKKILYLRSCLRIKSPSLLFIGRHTCKAHLHLLFDAISHANDLSLDIHLVGISQEELDVLCKSSQQCANVVRLHAYGLSYDQTLIESVALKCSHSIYPGDAGLSLIECAKLGCIPILHSDAFFHMPEFKAYSSRHRYIPFKRADHKSLYAALCSLTSEESQPFTQMEYSLVLDSFAASKTISSFLLSLS